MHLNVNFRLALPSARDYLSAVCAGRPVMGCRPENEAEHISARHYLCMSDTETGMFATPWPFWAEISAISLAHARALP